MPRMHLLGVLGELSSFIDFDVPILSILLTPDVTAPRRLQHAAFLAFREFVPAQQSRRLLTWKTGPQAFLYLVPYFFMAYLARRRDTHLMRVLLLPTIVAMAVRCTWSFTIGNPYFAFFEWDRG